MEKKVLGCTVQRNLREVVWFQIMYQRMYTDQVRAALPRAVDPASVGLPQAAQRNLERRELGLAEQIDDGPQLGHEQRVNDL